MNVSIDLSSCIKKVYDVNGLIRDVSYDIRNDFTFRRKEEKGIEKEFVQDSRNERNRFPGSKSTW